MSTKAYEKKIQSKYERNVARRISEIKVDKKTLPAILPGHSPTLRTISRMAKALRTTVANLVK